MHNPVSTYRIQFHKDFSFDDFEVILPYLKRLGINTVYASPIFEATPGSTHGYDSVNPHRINPEVGTLDHLKRIRKELKESEVNWLQDIVPNHMAFHPNNAWLSDLLEKGPRSIYAPFFDTAWSSKLYNGRIMVPFLGSPLEEVIEKNELKVSFGHSKLVLKYYNDTYPLSLQSYKTILSQETERPDDVTMLLDQIEEIKKMDSAEGYSLRMEEFKLQFNALMKEDKFKNYVNRILETINKSVEHLNKIAEEQSYELCYWQDTDSRINFRRFFTINGLICLNIQDPKVFHLYHKLIKELLEEGVFNGLRIDHIDGLYDPEKYLKDLRALAGDETYVIVEKILEAGEKLPKWPMQGNTGYDFLAIANNVFTNRESKEAFTHLYQELTNRDKPIHNQILEKKAYILREHMAGELHNLHHLFIELNLVKGEKQAEAEGESFKTLIGEFLIQCPVYRLYGNQFPLSEKEGAAVVEIFDSIKKTRPELTSAAGILKEVLLETPLSADEEYNEKVCQFYQRCMQFTGPLMAKGVEDTLMYTYNRFIGHNEVGDAPEAFGISVEEFHRQMQERQEQWPLSINATSTHDTKRGEDVRMRLNALSGFAEEWIGKVKNWRKQNVSLKKYDAPDNNDEYLIYQTILGAYPFPGQDEDDFKSRLGAYLEKALREAKSNSNWTQPNEPYEKGTKEFAESLLDQNQPFWQDFEPFYRKVADFGIVNSLAQILLKFTCPGVPDVYQGTEL